MLNTLLYLTPRISRTCVAYLFLMSVPFCLFAQSVKVKAESLPLNEVFINLITEYDVQISFDDQLLSRYQVTLDRSFRDHDEAVNYLISGLPLKIEKKDNVYIIVPEKGAESKERFRYSGHILDRASGETLPYSHIMFEAHGMTSDRNGAFSYESPVDSALNLRISYLGYFILDTVLQPGINQKIFLEPSIIGLKEVTIEGNMVAYTVQIGDKPGTIRLNHKIAYRLPGNGDNSIFNLLRLQPGILAAGEQSNDLIIWGGYEGHSQVLFDGFTVYGLKNFNDNISAVNPYMAKDIMVLKGGYTAEYGDRIGGIVNISGIDGNIYAPSFNFNINNMTLNGMASVPVTDQSALIFAFRRTYYNLYDPEDVNLLPFSSRRGNNVADINVYPDYVFGDLNIKYSGSSNKGDSYFLSLYRGKDNFRYRVDQTRSFISVLREAEEKSGQLGGTAYWSRLWTGGLHSSVSLSYSGLKKNLFDLEEIKIISTGEQLSNDNYNILNAISEVNFKNNYELSLSGVHRVQSGWGLVYNQTVLQEGPGDTLVSNTERNTYRFNLFLQDKINLFSNHLQLVPGLRIDYPVQLSRLYLQPRISLSVPLDEFWKVNGAWGIYNQFISKTSVLDDYGNYQYFWALCNNIDVPVLRSLHYVAGISYQRKQLTVSLETYLKYTGGLTRYINIRREDFQAVYQGEGKSYGLDLYVKANLYKHEAWISYTLSKTTEYFPYFISDEYLDAPQDQRHEIKSALLLNFDPFFLSFNYVYGSGFRERPYIFREFEEDRQPYSRLDAALIYRHVFKNFHMEAGISVLNVMNTENLKYSNLFRIYSTQSNSINIYAEAIPFTPTIYMNILF